MESLQYVLMVVKRRCLPLMCLRRLSPLTALIALAVNTACGDASPQTSNDGANSAGDSHSAGTSEPGATGSGASSESSAVSPAATSVAPGPASTDSAGLGTVTIKHSASRVISRLTNAQYLRSAEVLLGVDASALAAQMPDLAPNAGYSNSGHAQSQPYDLIVAFDTVARGLVDAVSDWTAFTARYGGCADVSCTDDFIRSFGERAFRRPLTADETRSFSPIRDAAAELGLTYHDTVSLLVRAFLQAPEFLYLFEDSPLTDFQLASRLAFFLTDGPPDDALYAAATAGALSTASELEAHTTRLLSEHGERFARAFVYDFFNLRKAYQRTVNVDEATIAALITSLQDTFGELIAKDAPLSALLTTRSYKAGPEAAAYLGLVPTGEHVTAPETAGFIGLVTHPASLIAMSNSYEGSMVSRGIFLAHQLMCVPPTPPPARAFTPSDVAGELPPDPTQRDEAEARLKDSNCLGCHIQFEPYAFALNRWAGDGRYNPDERLRDNGPVRTSLGELNFTSYQDFFPLLAKSTQYQTCLTDHLVQYALRHTNYDNAVTAAVLSAAKQGDAEDPTFGNLVRLIVQHPVFGNR